MLKPKIHNHIFSIAHRNTTGYDIPLHTRLGTEFLVLLIALMTYLLLLAATGNAGLGQLANKWVSGLANTMTIEVPASDTAIKQALSLTEKLQQTNGIKTAKILSQEDMGEMLSPWLGNQTAVLSDLPLPTLVSVEMEQRTDQLADKISSLVRTYAPSAIVDAHEDWLVDLLKLTNGLRLTSLVVFTLILFVTALVIAGAVRSRMAIHQRELELLHIMGASDRYVSVQFIRYIFSQSIKGIFYGLLLGVVTLAGFAVYTNQTSGTLPSVHLGQEDFLIFVAIPLLLVIIGTITARQTVLSVLNEMP